MFSWQHGGRINLNFLERGFAISFFGVRMNILALLSSTDYSRENFFRLMAM